MGMFDSAFAPCPMCGEMVEFQSKAGECLLRRYHMGSVPPEIAKDIDGNSRSCQCGYTVTIRLARPIERAQMQVEKPTHEAWD